MRLLTAHDSVAGLIEGTDSGFLRTLDNTVNEAFWIKSSNPSRRGGALMRSWHDRVFSAMIALFSTLDVFHVSKPRTVWTGVSGSRQARALCGCSRHRYSGL